jgi:uncharacterized protein (DUF4415 family)
MSKRVKPKHISQEDWDAVDSPPIPDYLLKRMRPATETMPEVVEAYRQARGRPKSENPKQLVSLRLDTDVVRAFREEGPGWQTRINETLAKAVKNKRRR